MNVAVIFLARSPYSHTGCRHPHCSKVKIHAGVGAHGAGVNDSTTSLLSENEVGTLVSLLAIASAPQCGAGHSWRTDGATSSHLIPARH
jgi:hypothetical protein